MAAVMRSRAGWAAIGLAAAGFATQAPAYNEKVDQNAQMLCFGLNLAGQLGVGHDRNMSAPCKVNDLSNLRLSSVRAGDHASAATTEDGRLYTWGSGAYARLGHGDESSLNLPRLNENLLGKEIVDVALGGFHALALDTNGAVYTWGRAVASGQGSNSTVLVPTKLSGPAAQIKMKAISAGRLHSAAIGEDGSVWTWGNNFEGELGHGDKKNSPIPQRLEALKDMKAVDVACGKDFTMVLLEDGTLYSCGADDYGQLGLGRGHGERYVLSPRKVVGGLSDVKQVVVGDYHSCALTNSGAVFTWGMGRDGQLGHGEKTDQAIPKKVEGLNGVKIDSVCCGGGHTGAISESGDLFLWGRGRDGQMGQGGELESIAAYRLTPKAITFKDSVKVLQASLGADHTAVLVAKDNT